MQSPAAVLTNRTIGNFFEVLEHKNIPDDYSRRKKWWVITVVYYSSYEVSCYLLLSWEANTIRDLHCQKFCYVKAFDSIFGK